MPTGFAFMDSSVSSNQLLSSSRLRFMSKPAPSPLKDVFAKPGDGQLDVLIVLAPLPSLDSLASHFYLVDRSFARGLASSLLTLSTVVTP